MDEMIDVFHVIGYTPHGCTDTNCGMFGACGLEDQLAIAMHLGVLGNKVVRDSLRNAGVPVDMVVSGLEAKKAVAA